MDTRMTICADNCQCNLQYKVKGCRDMCKEIYIGPVFRTCIDMFMDKCKDMRGGMCRGMCVDVSLDQVAHRSMPNYTWHNMCAHGHAYKHHICTTLTDAFVHTPLKSLCHVSETSLRACLYACMRASVPAAMHVCMRDVYGDLATSL